MTLSRNQSVDTALVTLNFYRFRSVWSVDASPSLAFDVLAELSSYPTWWPEVREAVHVHDECAEVRCRSFLPCDLIFEARHSAKDRQAGLLRAQLVGDLEGYVSWEVIGHSGSSRLLFDQEVIVRKPVLRRIALVSRPFVKANYEVMMRSGQRGLRNYLATRAVS